MADIHVAEVQGQGKQRKRLVAEPSEGDETNLVIKPTCCVSILFHASHIPSPSCPPLPPPSFFITTCHPANLLFREGGDKRLARWKHLGTMKLGLSSGKVRYATIRPTIWSSNIMPLI